MRTPTDNPIDPLGNLGAPVRPPAPAPAPSPVDVFNSGNWLPPGLKEKPAAPPAPTPDPLDVRNGSWQP